MSSTGYSGKKASANNHGALAEKRRDPREEQLTVPVAQRVDGAEHLLQQVAETQAGDELDFRPNKGRDSRAGYYQVQEDYNWARDTQVAPGRRFGETLAQQERRRGRKQELARQQLVAREAHDAGIKRVESARLQSGIDTPYQQTTSNERPDVESHDGVDPRETLTQSELAAVNQAADELADKLHDVEVGRPALARCIARRVQRGSEPTFARMSVERSFRGIDGVSQPLADIDPGQWRATVEAEVTRLFEHPAGSQYQAGYLEDSDGTERKFVYWQKSHKANGMPTLREGDQVRLENVAVNEWRGQACLAIIGDTDITIQERGDGPMHRTGSKGDTPSVGRWTVDADTHGWVATVDTDQALALLDH